MSYETEMKALEESEAAEAKYRTLRDALRKIEDATVGGLYLTDENIDHENTMEGEDCNTSLPYVEDSAPYWKMMYDQAASAAMYRAEEAGFNINDHFTPNLV